MLQKNQTFTVQIESVDGNMQGIAHVDGQTVFVPGALPGEEIQAAATRCEKRFAFARILSILKESPERVAPPCPYYKICGGCSALHMRYEESLRIKQEAVRQVLQRVGGIRTQVPLPLPMEHPFEYRNKTALPVALVDGTPRAGFYAPRSHRLTPVDRCLIAMPEGSVAANTVCTWMKRFGIEPYDETARRGLIRHVVTRTARSGEVMVTLAVSKEEIPHQDALWAMLREALPRIVSLCATVNPRGDNVILGRDYRVLFGASRLSDTLCGLSFSLSPLSFFQVNPVQTEKLYQTALRFAAPEPNDLAVDLYCGAGTISLLLARHVKNVIGIEIVPEAIRDARENAVRNGISNAEFHAAAAEKLLPSLVDDGLRPDFVVLDPPRKGAEPEVIRAIAYAAPSRVVYVSCDPATLARDLRLFTELGYQVSQVQPVDMFCWTGHVETVVLIQRDKMECQRSDEQ